MTLPDGTTITWYSHSCVRIDTAGRTVAVIAEQLHGTERDEAWREIAAAAPRFAKYQQKTDRELPIIRLKCSR